MMKLIKNINLVYLLLMMAFIGLLMAGCQANQPKAHSQAKVYYTCSMHPQVHEDKPGNCPICGMKLIKVEETNQKDTVSLDTALYYLTQPVTKTVTGSFKTFIPVKGNAKDTITADGMIDFDERDINGVASRVTGRIDKLYVKYSGQSIAKGQPLMEIYSPELLSVQRELLQTVKDNDPTLIKALKVKLRNLGMHQNEIQKVTESRKPLSQITIFSPYQGVARPVSDPAMDNSTPELLDIRKGMYVDAGQSIFSIQDITRRWALLHVFASDMAFIQKGDPVALNSEASPDQIINGQVDFIPPYRMENEKTTTIRVYLKNLPANWKIGTLVRGHIVIGHEDRGLYVPLSAVNRLGMRSVVWVKDRNSNDVFHARPVQTGIRTEDSIQIISGIKTGDQIVENAAYMVDSDSFIQ